jgi:hypothetical protein
VAFLPTLSFTPNQYWFQPRSSKHISRGAFVGFFGNDINQPTASLPYKGSGTFYDFFY